MKRRQTNGAVLLALLLMLTVTLSAVPVTAEAGTLTLDKTTYTEGEDILVTATGSGADWVGLYAAGDGVPGGGQVSIYWYHVAQDGNKSGEQKNIREAEFRNDRGPLLEIPAGDYVMFLCANDGYTVLAQVAFTVKPAPDQVPDAPASAVYTSDGVGAGRADGKLTVTEGAGSAKPLSYVAYWANADGVLPGWSAAATFARTGATTTTRLADNTLIPAGADRLLVFAQRRGACSANGTEALLPAGAADFDPGTLLGEMQVMSDIHINPSDDHLHNKHFAQALADIRTISPNSMGIFVNGDVADHGQVAEYEAFNGSSRRRATDCRLFCVPSATMTLTAGWMPRGRSGASSREPETARKPSGSTPGFPVTTLYFWAVRRQDCTPTCRTHSLHGWKRHWQRIA